MAFSAAGTFHDVLKAIAAVIVHLENFAKPHSVHLSVYLLLAIEDVCASRDSLKIQNSVRQSLFGVQRGQGQQRCTVSI